MHELTVTQSLLDLALEHTPAGQRITRLYLIIGQLSSIIDDSVQFYWEMIADGTPAAGSQLIFRRVAAVMECQDCQTRFPPGEDSFACPNCANSRVRVIAGNEFQLEAIDVEPAGEAG